MKKPNKEKSKEKAHPSSVCCFKTSPSGGWGWLCWSFSVPSSTHTICRDWGHNTFFCANMKRTCQVSKVDGKNSSLFSVCVYSYSGKWKAQMNMHLCRTMHLCNQECFSNGDCGSIFLRRYFNIFQYISMGSNWGSICGRMQRARSYITSWCDMPSAYRMPSFGGYFLLP